MRVEDLDGARSEPKYIDAALRDLAWLGLDWDGAPLIQSTWLARHSSDNNQLVERGIHYPCTCTRGDVRNAQSAPQLGLSEPRYPGTCRGRYGSVAEAEAQAGRPAGIRLRVPEGRIDFVDRLAGPQSFDVQAEVGDFLIARRNGAPAYQLAVVVDDAFQGVTEVVRGNDLLPSTARQIVIERALGYAEPTWMHLPLVVDASGRRLAKREAALGLAELRERGIDPRAVVGFVARASGMQVPPVVSAREALAAYDPKKLPLSDVSTASADFLRA
jgi:glutamyl-tRNA synthetase